MHFLLEYDLDSLPTSPWQHLVTRCLVPGVPAPDGLPVPVVQRQRADEQLLGTVRLRLLVVGRTVQAATPSRADAQHLAAGAGLSVTPPCQV